MNLIEEVEFDTKSIALTLKNMLSENKALNEMNITMSFNSIKKKYVVSIEQDGDDDFDRGYILGAIHALERFDSNCNNDCCKS